MTGTKTCPGASGEADDAAGDKDAAVAQAERSAPRIIPDQNEFLLGCEDTVAPPSETRRALDPRTALELASGLIWPRPGNAQPKGRHAERAAARIVPYGGRPQELPTRKSSPPATVRVEVVACDCRPNQTIVILATAVLGFALAVLLVALRVSLP